MSTSYDDCQDIEREHTRDEREGEIRQRLLGPIGLRPLQQQGIPLRERCLKCIATKAQELLDNAESAEGYGVTHYQVGDPVGTERYVDGDCWVISTELMSELEDLLDDLKTIEQEGW